MDKCPKCGANGFYRKNEGDAFECRSVTIQWQSDVFVQSPECRIRELEAENARLRARVEELENDIP